MKPDANRAGGVFHQTVDDEKFLGAAHELLQVVTDIGLRSNTRPDHAKTMFGLEIS